MKPTALAAVLLATACLGLGASTLRLTAANRALQQQLDAARAAPAPAPAAHATSNDPGGYRQALEAEAAINASLRAELERLRQRLAGATGALATATAPPSTHVAGGGTDRDAGNRDRGSWLERLREEDPARYQQIQEERERRRQVIDEWFQQKLAALDERIQNATSREEAELADQIAATLARANELRAQWAALRDLPDDQRRAAAEQLQQETRATFRRLNELREQDRQLQLTQLARALGADPNHFVETVTSIYRNTDFIPGRGGGAGNGPRGFGDGSGGGPPVAAAPGTAP
jgi:hypothetical protein